MHAHKLPLLLPQATHLLIQFRGKRQLSVAVSLFSTMTDVRSWIQQRGVCSLLVSLRQVSSTFPSACAAVSLWKKMWNPAAFCHCSTSRSCPPLLKIFDTELISVTQSLSVSLSPRCSCTFWQLEEGRNYSFEACRHAARMKQASIRSLKCLHHATPPLVHLFL